MRIDLSQAVSEGGRIYGKGVGPMALFLIVYGLISFVAAWIPGVSTLYSLAIDPVLGAGMIYMAHQLYTSQRTSVETGFKGFKKIVGIAVINLITGIIIGVLFVLVLLPFIASDFSQVIDDIQMLSQFEGATDPDDAQAMIDQLFGIFTNYLPALIAASFVAMLASIPFIFAPFYYIVGEREIGESISKGFKAGLANMHILVLFLIVLGIVSGLSIFTAFIALLFIIPYSQCILYAMYRQMEPVELEPEANEEILDL